MTPRTIETLGGRLGLEPQEIETFLLHEKIVVPSNVAISREIRQLTQDAAALLSDGCHRSIIELMKIDEFVPDVRWIARVLNVSADDVNVAVTRLLRLGLLEMSGHDQWIDRSGDGDNGVSDNQFARLVVRQLSDRVRNLQTSAAMDGIEALSNFPAFKVEFRSAQMPVVIEMIRRLERQLEKGGIGEDGSDPELQLEIGIIPINDQTQRSK